MRPKTMLCVTDADEGDITLAKAMALAGDADCFLSVLVVKPMPTPLVSAYDMVNTDIWMQQSEAAKQRCAEREQEIEALLQQNNRPGAVFSSVAPGGNLAEITGRAARYNDLTFLSSREDCDRELHRAVVTGAMFEAGCPVLTCSGSDTPTLPPEKCLIAWNASQEAGRAVRTAIPFLQQARDVTILLIDPVPSFGGHGEEPGVDIARYLAHHDISPTVSRVPSEGHSVEEIIRRTVETTGTDMLIMGGYSHARIRQRIFGGTTSDILEHPPCPTFMVH